MKWWLAGGFWKTRGNVQGNLTGVDAEIRKKSGITSQVQGWKRVRSKILAKSEKQGPETKGKAQSRIF